LKIDEDLGALSVTRIVSAIAAGRILNPKTARSQIIGGIVWGISMALEEESVIDQNWGRFMNHNLAEYHVAVNADVHDIEVIFVEEPDSIVIPWALKGWANSVSSAWQRRSPMLCSTLRANVSAICPSPSTK